MPSSSGEVAGHIFAVMPCKPLSVAVGLRGSDILVKNLERERSVKNCVPDVLFCSVLESIFDDVHDRKNSDVEIDFDGCAYDD